MQFGSIGPYKNKESHCEYKKIKKIKGFDGIDTNVHHIKQNGKLYQAHQMLTSNEVILIK